MVCVLRFDALLADVCPGLTRFRKHWFRARSVELSENDLQLYEAFLKVRLTNPCKIHGWISENQDSPIRNHTFWDAFVAWGDLRRTQNAFRARPIKKMNSRALCRFGSAADRLRPRRRLKMYDFVWGCLDFLKFTRVFYRGSSIGPSKTPHKVASHFLKVQHFSHEINVF
jgi:hypothetical protein